MPAYPREFPIDDLMRVEDSVHKMNEGEFLDGIFLVGPRPSEKMDDPVSYQLVNDWKKILSSFRARKMKEAKLAQRYLFSTEFAGYHFFKR